MHGFRSGVLSVGVRFVVAEAGPRSVPPSISLVSLSGLVWLAFVRMSVVAGVVGVR